MHRYKVGYIIGSLATASINRQLAKALVRLAPPELQMTEIPFKDLPLYSYDYDEDFPPPARAFKDSLAAVDAVLFVTPEYNRSIPGGLKNAIDWASRPYGKNSFTRKPSAVIGTSPGMIGTALAQQALRGVLGFLAEQRVTILLGDLIVIGVDFRKGQEAVTVAAVIDERRLKRRFDPGNLG